MPGVIIAIIFVIFLVQIILSATKEIKKAEEAERRRRESRSRIQQTYASRPSSARGPEPPPRQSRPPLTRPEGRRQRPPLVTPGDLGMEERAAPERPKRAPSRPSKRRQASSPGRVQTSSGERYQDRMAELESRLEYVLAAAESMKQAPASVPSTKKLKRRKEARASREKERGAVPAAEAPSGDAFYFDPAEARKAILYSTILGPPRCQKPWAPLKP